MTDQLENTPVMAGIAPDVKMQTQHAPRRNMRFPQWLRKPIPARGKKGVLEDQLQQHRLHTVCEEAKCPNRCECFAEGTATFLIMGAVCTRNCLFCNISHGAPEPLDTKEPERLCSVVKKMGLAYVVITMVTRDDLDDGGAAHIIKTITLLKHTIPEIIVEVLVPDFGGNMQACATVAAGGADVFSHNIETVHSLFSGIRPDAKYSRSMQILRTASVCKHPVTVKSGFMVGLGEKESEVISVMRELRASGVSILTIGQYLQPSQEQIPVREFITPQQFDRYRQLGLDLGFTQVESAPFVRSSYGAKNSYLQTSGR